MDLMIKIKTYVYTYVGLFSSKLQLINSRIQPSWVNRDIFSGACRICLLFTIPNFWRTIFTVTKRNSHVDKAQRPIFSNPNFERSTTKRDGPHDNLFGYNNY